MDNLTIKFISTGEKFEVIKNDNLTTEVKTEVVVKKEVIEFIQGAL